MTTHDFFDYFDLRLKESHALSVELNPVLNRFHTFGFKDPNIFDEAIKQYIEFPRIIVELLVAAQTNIAEFKKDYHRWGRQFADIDNALTKNINEERGSETNNVSHVKILEDGLKGTIGLEVPENDDESRASAETKNFLETLRRELKQGKTLGSILGVVYAIESSAVPEIKVLKSILDLRLDHVKEKMGTKISPDWNESKPKLDDFIERHLNEWEPGHRDDIKAACRPFIGEGFNDDFKNGFNVVIDAMEYWWFGLSEKLYTPQLSKESLSKSLLMREHRIKGQKVQLGLDRNRSCEYLKGLLTSGSMLGETCFPLLILDIVDDSQALVSASVLLSEDEEVVFLDTKDGIQGLVRQFWADYHSLDTPIILNRAIVVVPEDNVGSGLDYFDVPYPKQFWSHNVDDLISTIFMSESKQKTVQRLVVLSSNKANYLVGDSRYQLANALSELAAEQYFASLEAKRKVANGLETSVHSLSNWTKPILDEALPSFLRAWETGNIEWTYPYIQMMRASALYVKCLVRYVQGVQSDFEYETVMNSLLTKDDLPLVELIVQLALNVRFDHDEQISIKNELGVQKNLIESLLDYLGLESEKQVGDIFDQPKISCLLEFIREPIWNIRTIEDGHVEVEYSITLENDCLNIIFMQRETTRSDHTDSDLNSRSVKTTNKMFNHGKFNYGHVDQANAISQANDDGYKTVVTTDIAINLGGSHGS